MANLTERQQENLDILKMLRMKGEENFFFFAKEICEFGHNPNPKGPRVTDDQKELCDFLQAIYDGDEKKIRELAFKSFSDEEKKRFGISSPEDIKYSHIQSIILTPRGTLKSTILQAFALWITRKNPDVRILFYGEVHEHAQKRLAVIKRIITGCKTFRDIYGDLDGSVAKLPWNENIAVLRDRKNKSIREATFECAGLDVVVNARHFDWIFPDDLLSEKNTGTKDQVEAVAEQVRLLTPLLDEGSKIVFTGVFWNDSDFHVQLVESGRCNVFLRSCYEDEKKTISAYPHVFSSQTLKEKAGMMSESEFSCHYLLNPVNASTQAMPKVRFPIIPRMQFRTLRNYLTIDPAGDPTSENAEKRDSDFYGMELWSANGEHDVMLSDGFMEKCSPAEAVQFALDLIIRYKPFVIGIERAAVGNLRFYLQEEILKRGIFALIVDLLPKGRSKHQRVIAWEPYTRRRKVMIAEECPIKDPFLEQIVKVTNSGIKAKHDDLIDPFGYLMDLIREYGMPIASQNNNEIPLDLMHLDERSREYWMSVRKKEHEAKQGSWVGDFCA